LPRLRLHIPLLASIALGALAGAALAQSPFDPPPFPSGDERPAPTVRGLYDPNTPAASPAGVAGAPAATFAAPGGQTAEPASTGETAPAPADARPIEGSQIIARVEDQVILASDVLWQVNQMIAMNPRPVPPDQLPEVQKMLMQRMVVQLIDTKLLFADFRRTVPAENMGMVEKSIAEPFEKVEVPKLIELFKVKGRTELEEAMKRSGTSLKDVQRQFTEKTVAGEWLRQRTPKPQPITHEEMLAYYQDHLKEYEYPPQVKWEELMVRFDRTGGDRDAAWAALANMANEVWKQAAANPGVRGPVFAAVARAQSHGVTAAEGGVRETEPGSLLCEELNQALAKLQLGQFSNGIESDQGFHIVRVLARKPGGRKPFTEAQAKIRELLEKEQRAALVAAELAKVRKSARVWTIFDGELSGERLARALDGGKKR
jgi:hypothetical protein